MYIFNFRKYLWFLIILIKLSTYSWWEHLRLGLCKSVYLLSPIRICSLFELIMVLNLLVKVYFFVTKHTLFLYVVLKKCSFIFGLNMHCFLRTDILSYALCIIVIYIGHPSHFRFYKEVSLHFVHRNLSDLSTYVKKYILFYLTCSKLTQGKKERKNKEL